MSQSIFILNGELVTISSKIRWYQTVRFKLFTAVLLVSIVPLIIFSIYMVHTLGRYFEESSEREALYQANKIAGSIQKAGYLTSPNKKDDLIAELSDKSSEGGFRIIVVDANGYVVSDTNNSATGKVYLVPEILVALSGRDEANLRQDEKAVYASAYIENSASKKIGAVLVVTSFDDIHTLLSEINARWMVIAILIAIIVIILVFVMARIIMEPLKNISVTIQKISAGQLHQRIETKGHDEFAHLSEAINNMTTRLEQMDSSRQEFVSNVSHELKTPLSSIKVLTESILLQENVPTEMYSELLRDINSEIDRMTNIVNDLLSLVRLDYNGAKLNIAETDVNKMLRDIIKRIKPLADNKSITLNYDATKEVTIDADEVKLSLAISNLVENGVKYTPVGGEVSVSLDADHQNCYITVQDTGIGIDEEEQSKIFERFYRIDKTRDRETGGTGLGLAITHSTIVLHNGSVKIISGEGQGATFIVRLPLKYQQS